MRTPARSPHRYCLPFLLGMLLLSASPRAAAAVLVTHTPSADFTPPIAPAVANPPGDSSMTTITWRWVDDTKHRDVGQQFQVDTTFTLSSIVLLVSSGNVTADTGFTLVVEQFANSTSTSTASVTSERTEISSQSGLLPSISQAGYLTFQLEEPVSIEAGKRYGFRLIFDDESSTNSVVWQVASGGGSYLYPQYMIDYAESTTPAAANSRAIFYLVPIPEPSSTALLLGLGALVAFVPLLLKRSGNCRHSS